MGLTDQECVERCRDGDPEDFCGLVHRCQGPLFAFLADRLRNRTLAEEAAQESFVRVFLSPRKLRKPGLFYSWMLGIAGRVTKEQLRVWQRRSRDCELTDAFAADAPDSTDDYPLDEAIAALPETYRRVILLRYYEELSCQETATRLDLPLGTVTQTLSRTYVLLRRELEACESAESTVNHTKGQT
jgi:RNA polymerase sigma-70 factor (ECF subfamily)